MCGIVGAVAERNILPILLEGLKRLEYRGYDSAGLAFLNAQNQFQRLRAVGKVEALAKKVNASPLHAQMGIAHTRWATHGKPTEDNAHPHIAGNIVLVHNGIIENYAELKLELIKAGAHFESETDTEVIAHLLNRALSQESDPRKAIESILPRLKGAYALVIMHHLHPDRLFAVRKGSPLVIGLGIEENFVGSDSLSLLPVTRQFIYLEDNDIAEISRFTCSIYNAGQAVHRPTEELQISDDAGLKGHFRHFMQKEIYEQPQVVAHILSQYVQNGRVLIDGFGMAARSIFPQVKHIKIVACGTSYHAGLVAKYWLEGLAKISCDVEIASEYRYRESVVLPHTLFISISQSGETADTLAALRLSKTQPYLARLAICNVASSTLIREAELCFLMSAGVEIGVASTKAFTAQILGLFLLTTLLCELNNHPCIALHQLENLPNLMNQLLELDGEIEKIAESFKHKTSALFLGRGLFYPLAMEAALKLKEVSYIHAEAYAAGELKHGPLALVDEAMPVVVMMSEDALQEKIKSNIEEVGTRGGELFVFGDIASLPTTLNAKSVQVSSFGYPLLYPLFAIIPMQLLAYHVAILKGTDVDQPRNLAKSVTVE